MVVCVFFNRGDLKVVISVADPNYFSSDPTKRFGSGFGSLVKQNLNNYKF